MILAAFDGYSFRRLIMTARVAVQIVEACRGDLRQDATVSDKVVRYEHILH